MRDPAAEALSRTLWHRSLPPATPGPWAGSHSPTLPFPPHPPASRQDTQTHATVSTVGAQAASTARVSNEKEGQDEPFEFSTSLSLINVIIWLNMQHDIMPNLSIPDIWRQY